MATKDLQASDNDRIIGDYLDAMFAAPMPIRSLTSGFELVCTIPLQSIVSGERHSSHFENVMILLVTARLLKQLDKDSALHGAVLRVGEKVITLIHKHRSDGK